VRRLVKRQQLASGRRGPSAPPPHAARARPRRTVVILWAWTALLSGVACCRPTRTRDNALVPFASPRHWPSCCSPGSTPGSGSAGSARNAAGTRPPTPATRSSTSTRRRRQRA
jgi:hypothetical protein